MSCLIRKLIFLFLVILNFEKEEEEEEAWARNKEVWCVLVWEVRDIYDEKLNVGRFYSEIMCVTKSQPLIVFFFCLIGR